MNCVSRSEGLKPVSAYIILFEIGIFHSCYWECQTGQIDPSTDNLSAEEDSLVEGSL